MKEDFIMNHIGLRNSGGMMKRAANNFFSPIRQNVCIQVKEYQLECDRMGAIQKVSTPGKDVLIGYLLHDVPEWNMTAQFSQDDNGNVYPVTEVKIIMPLPPNVTSSDRRDIFGLSRPRGQGEAMLEGSKIIFEKSWFDSKENAIKSYYAHTCATKAQMESGLRVVHSNMLACVRPERWIYEKGGGGHWHGRSDVFIAIPDWAVIIQSLDQMKDAFINHIEIVNNQDFGEPGFILLARELCPQNFDPQAFAANMETRYGTWHVLRKRPVEENGYIVAFQQTDPEESLENFGNLNAQVLNLIGDSNWQIEFVPMIMISQAKTRVESKTKDHADPALPYGIFDATTQEDIKLKNAKHPATMPDGGVWGMVDIGWTLSHVAAERKDASTNAWYSTYQAPMSQKAKVFSVHDIITPLTPDYHVPAIEDAVADNQRRRSEYWSEASKKGRNN